MLLLLVVARRARHVLQNKAGHQITIDARLLVLTSSFTDAQLAYLSRASAVLSVSIIMVMHCTATSQIIQRQSSEQVVEPAARVPILVHVNRRVALVHRVVGRSVADLLRRVVVVVVVDFRASAVRVVVHVVLLGVRLSHIAAVRVARQSCRVRVRMRTATAVSRIASTVRIAMRASSMPRVTMGASRNCGRYEK